jgi:hypothetical protein
MEQMEIMIELAELPEADLDAVVGGVGTIAFSFSNTASGTTAVRFSSFGSNIPLGLADGSVSGNSMLTSVEFNAGFFSLST